jgi:hypothetical protein
LPSTPTRTSWSADHFFYLAAFNTLKSLALTATYSSIPAHTLDFTRFRVTFKQLAPI